MKRSLSRTAVRSIALLVLVGAVCLFSMSAHAVNYNAATTVMIYVHGFAVDGYQYTGVFGDDPYGLDIAEDIDRIAGVGGLPTYATNPTAPNQVAGCEYYGTTPPSWYTAADIAEDTAIGGYVPRYALRTAKYIRHVLARATTATGVNLVAGSFGGEITRYMIEHNLCNLASDQLIARWNTVVGVVAGNYAATYGPVDLVQILGYGSPDMDEMTYDWVNTNISARETMNTPYLAPMIITHFIATDDTEGLVSGLTGGAYGNDSVCLIKDSKFSGYTTTAALHPATDGTLLMGGVSYQHCKHQKIVDKQGAWAGIMAASQSNKRVTIKLSRIKALSSGDSWIQGDGEWVLSFTATSPMAASVYGVTDPLTDIRWSDGAMPLYSLGKNETQNPNTILFDQIVTPGETQLNITLEPEELDYFYNFYNIVENPFGDNKSMGVVAATVSATGDSTITLRSTYFEVDLTTTVKYVY